MLEAAKLLRTRFPDLRFATTGATPVLTERLRAMIREAGLENAFEVGVSSSHEIMCRATAGVVASGTATLEAACLGLPYVLTYKVAWLTALVARRVMSVRFLGIVNVMADREVVKELLQERADGALIADEVGHLIEDSEARRRLQDELLAVVEKLGGGGSHERAALAVAAAWVEPS